MRTNLPITPIAGNWNFANFDSRYRVKFAEKNLKAACSYYSELRFDRGMGTNELPEENSFVQFSRRGDPLQPIKPLAAGGGRASQFRLKFSQRGLNLRTRNQAENESR
jgi:hypothetical protein